jgi:peroxiredoxin-like protein
MANVHEYPVSVVWKGAREGEGKVTSDRTGTEVPLQVPPEFGGGEEKSSNPEEMLASAVASCYAITFGIIAENRKLPIKDFHAKVTGAVEVQGSQHKYTRITINPKIVLESNADYEQVKSAEDMAHKAVKYCIISNALRGNVELSVEPEITRE